MLWSIILNYKYILIFSGVRIYSYYEQNKFSFNNKQKLSSITIIFVNIIFIYKKIIF